MCELAWIAYVVLGLFVMTFWWYVAGLLAGYAIEVAAQRVQLAPEESRAA